MKHNLVRIIAKSPYFDEMRNLHEISVPIANFDLKQKPNFEHPRDEKHENCQYHVG